MVVVDIDAKVSTRLYEKGSRNVGLGTHLDMAREGINRRRKIYEETRRPFDTNAHIFLWRNNISYQQALLDAMLAVLKPCDYGLTTQKWREMSTGAQIITRVFFSHIIMTGRSVMISDVEARLMPEAGVEYDRSTIRDVLNYGVELGLLSKSETEGQRSHKYSPENLLFEEMFERLIAKITDPAVVKFAKLVLTYHSMTEIATQTTELEKNKLQNFGPNLTVQEDVMDGKYDEVIARLIAEEAEYDVELAVFRGDVSGDNAG